MEEQCKLPCSSSNIQQPCLSRLTATPDLGNISSVEYAHDPIPNAPSFLAAKDVPFPQRERDHPDKRYAIKLRPRESNLPYRCTLEAAHESRFWKSGLKASHKLLELLADDRSITDIIVGKGETMARLAQRELRKGFEHRFCKASSYMYPFSDEKRTKLLASSMVMMFLFDDKGEETSDSTLKPFVEDFVNRINNSALESPSDNQLQRHIDFIINSFRDADLIAGNAGHEVIEAMSQSFRRMRPELQFQNLRQYLEFRHDNVGANYVLAGVKFSICSSVEISDPRLAKYLSLIKDHLAIINDMASFDKESRMFNNGSSKDLINVVAVIQHLLSLADTDSAKTMAYAYQLQTEAWLIEELQRLKDEEDLDVEQWQYLEATYVCAAGNAFFSMTSSRYGGEAARIHAQCE